MKFSLTLLAATVSFSAISHAMSFPPSGGGPETVVTVPPVVKTSLSLPPNDVGPQLSLPPDEQGPPKIPSDGLTVITPADDDAIRDLLPRLVSADSAELAAMAKNLSPAQKAALYKTAMVARKLLIEAQQ